MGRVHYRVRGPRHAHTYRGSGPSPRPVAPPLPEARARAAVPRREGLGVVSPESTDVWRRLLEPDGTPPALPLQVAYVRRAVWQATGMNPSLRGLTIGQAERVLGAVGADPSPLWRAGRDLRAFSTAALAARVTLLVLLCLGFLDLGRIAGVPFVLIVLATAGAGFARRQRRQAYEERHYRRHGASETAPPAGPGGVQAGTKGEPPAPPRGNPYDVETYLRRLREDHP